MSDNDNVFKLSRPLHTHKGDVTEITLKEPTAGTFIRAKGDPFKLRFIDGKPDYDFDSAASMAFLCEMTGLDQIVLEALPGCDFIGLRYALVNVIAEGLGADRNPSEA
jgi:hypothetical protein